MEEKILSNEEIELELSKYYGKGFDQDQILEIREGLIRGLKVSFYTNPNMTASQMRSIWQDLYAQKVEAEEKEKENEKIRQEIEKKDKEIQTAQAKSHRRETAIVTLVLEIFAIAVLLFKIFGLITSIF